MDNRATIIIDCEENTIEIRTKPIEIKDLEFSIRDNKAEIIAQLAYNYLNELMHMTEKDLKIKMVRHLK